MEKGNKVQFGGDWSEPGNQDLDAQSILGAWGGFFFRGRGWCGHANSCPAGLSHQNAKVMNNKEIAVKVTLS